MYKQCWNCLQLCTNAIGSCYACSCNTGYTLSASKEDVLVRAFFVRSFKNNSNNNDDTVEERAIVKLVQSG